VSFGWPIALVGLVAIPVVVALYARREQDRKRFAGRWGNPALLPNLVDRPPGRLRHVPFAVLVVALAAMVVGVARPHATVSVRSEEATVMLVLDVSRSMTADDVPPTRLGAARSAAEAFLARIPKKFRVGVISVGTRAAIAVPPTADRNLATQALRSLRPSEGTAIGDGIALAVRIAQRQRTSSGTHPPTAVLLISDGAAQGGGTPLPVAAARAKAAHIPVYTIVIGTSAGTVTVTLTGGLKEVIRVPPDPTALQTLAAATGGRSFTVRTDERLREVYERLGSKLGKHRTEREVTDLFAGGSALLLLGGGAMSLLFFRRVP
jgi:Ca-activated chloride channel family protein